MIRGCGGLIIGAGAAAAGAAAAPGQTLCETAHVTSPDPMPFDCFGDAVAIDGTTAVVGAEHVDIGGAAYIFDFSGETWSLTQVLQPSDLQTADDFGQAVAIRGDTAMVTSLQHTHDESNSGAVYVFQRRGDGTWVETQEILNGVQFDGFSFSVDFLNDRAVVGAPGDDELAPGAGALFVYRLDPGTGLWVFEQKLLASDGAAGDFFGESVGISGDVIVGGAQGHEMCGAEPLGLAGAAYVFRRLSAASPSAGPVWVQEQKLFAPDCEGGDHFGEVVDIDGDVIIAGAEEHFHSPSFAEGAAYVFRFDGDAWQFEQELVASEDVFVGLDFAWSVAVEGDVALVGHRSNITVDEGFGAAYLFRRRGGVWLGEDKLLPDPGFWDARFGQSVALSGDFAVVGANGEIQQGGTAYMYSGALGADCNANGAADACDILDGGEADANGDGVPDTCCPWDLDADGVTGVLDFLALLAQWGTDPGGPPDFNGDGDVDVLDFLALLTNWGPCA